MSIATDDVGALGYKQELKRSLSLFDLLAYGLVAIVPIAPVAVFGIVFNASKGMVPLVYVIGLISMVFTALSYMAMTKAFPVAGSVYTYASRSLGSTVGFFAGWAILLDYLLVPTLCYVAGAIAISAVYPGIPKVVTVIAQLAVATLVNYFGIEATARTSFVLLAFQIVILVLFAFLGADAVIQHTGGAHLSLAPFFNAREVSPQLIFGALSLAVLSFLGFDAISTLSEESKGGPRTIGRATILSLCLSAFIFIAQTWLASLFFLGKTHLAAGDATNTAFYDVAALAGGYWFKLLLAVPGTLLSNVACAVTAQAATARLLYGMSRDGELPRLLAYVDPVRKVPINAVFAISAVTLILGVLLADYFELLTSMVSFGALLGFLLLHASVIAHFLGREKSREWLKHLAAPGIGFLVISYVLVNAERNAKIAGVSWLAFGLCVFAVLKLLKRPTALPT